MTYLSLDHHVDNIIQHIIFILCEHVAKNENATWVKSEIQDGRQGLIINDKDDNFAC